MKDFVPFGTDLKSMNFILTMLLKYNIYGFCVPQFHLSHILDTTHTSHNNLVKLCREVHYMWLVNQELELQ